MWPDAASIDVDAVYLRQVLSIGKGTPKPGNRTAPPRKPEKNLEGGRTGGLPAAAAWRRGDGSSLK